MVMVINDNIDILREILKRLDGPSLGVAACVCRLWCSMTRNDDSLWEQVCFRHVSSTALASVRAVVVALGGYKRLYMVCVRPVLSRLGGQQHKLHLSLSLSLFCIHSYERFSSDPASSLMFLCNTVNL
ncbi:hypothetical protein VNO78_32096 [Psophocarpus tetragonolobus]|uniref:F-box domain-containing protein n=1 Tax=Psophocarpus tetragonolobus TaxID=3891 RepID=A0AAN9XA64_PSOTE